MTQTKRNDDLDLGFMHAYASTHRTPSTEVSFTNNMRIGGLSVRVTISNSTKDLKASFDPVSSAQNRATQTINQAMRRGYKLPSASTR